jgi:hypothetical protein
MSGTNNKTPLQLPTEHTAVKIEEPPDPDNRTDDEGDSDGQPDQPDGEK